MGGVTLGVLSRSDVAWLRAASTVSFHCGRDAGHHIRVEAERYVAGQLFRLWHGIDVAGSIRHLDLDSVRRAGMHWSCYTSVGARTPTWRTLTRQLRAGDVVALEWTGSNNSENLRSVGFHADELRLSRQPAGEWARPVDEWLVSYQVGPSNTARMIRAVDGPAPTGRAPRRVLDEAALAAAVEGFVHGSGRRHATAAVSTSAAGALPSTVTVGSVAVTVVADAERFDDEIVVVDRAWSKVLGSTFVAPPRVRDAGAGAVEFYTQLRSDGTSPSDAAFLAIAAAGRRSA